MKFDVGRVGIFGRALESLDVVGAAMLLESNVDVVGAGIAERPVYEVDLVKEKVLDSPHLTVGFFGGFGFGGLA